MAAETIQTVVAVAGLVLALVGLPALFLQVRDLRQSIQSQAHAAMYAQSADFRSHLVQFPHLRRYLFDGVEIRPDHADHDRVATLAEIFLNCLEHVAVMGDSFGRHNRAALDRFCRTSLANGPILRQRLLENRDAYSGALTAYLAAAGPLDGAAATNDSFPRTSGGT